MVMVNKFGRTEPNTKEIGDSTKLVVKENSGTLMEIYSKVNGWMIRLMAMECMCIKMVQDMKVSGRMIFSTVLEKKSGQITVNTKDIIQKVRNTERASTSGKMAQCITVIGMKTALRAMVNTNGKMVGSTSASGRTTTCTEKESTPGLTVEDMRDSTRWTRSTASECIIGLTTESTRGIGLMASSMEEESISYKMAPSK